MSAINKLLDVSFGLTLVRILHSNVNRSVLVTTGEVQNRRRHSRGEQHGLAPGRSETEKLLNIWQETKIQHLIGLIQHHELDLSQIQKLLLGQVDESTRGSNHDLSTSLDLSNLTLVRLAAIDGCNLGAAV